MPSTLLNILPKPLRRRIRAFLLKHFFPEQETVAEGWDRYARQYRREKNDLKLGDEWNEAAILGLDMPDDDIIPYLDKNLFSPFLDAPDTILEIGAGGGRITSFLLPKCRRLIAADTSPHMQTLLRKRFPAESKLEFLLLNGKGLQPLPDRSVNAVVSFDVFVHLQQWDIFNYLREIARVLQPNGKALIHHAHLLSDLGWQRFLFDTSYSLNKPKPFSTFSVMTPDIMRRFVAATPLHIVDIDTRIIPRDAVTLLQLPAQNS